MYAQAKRCAELISKGEDCVPGREQGAAAARPDATADGRHVSRAKEAADGAGAHEEARVYIDASESMQGFASAPDNTFVKVVEKLGYAMPGCRLYKYGTPAGGTVPAAEGGLPFAREIRFSQELRKPTFYDLGFNEDDVLINHLADEETPARSVLLTDGVYSARNSELQSEVVKAAEKWLSKGRFLGILIFTSAFDGRVYSENSRGWTPRVSVSARPFYAFVFSPTERGFRDLRDQLSEEVGIAGSLAFPREAVSCRISPQDKEGLEKKDSPPRHPFYLHMYGASVFGENGRAELSYDLRCTPAADYPVSKFELGVRLDSYSWRQNSFARDEQAPQFEYKYEETGDAKDAPSPAPAGAAAAPPTPRPNLKLTFHRTEASSYSLYHVRFDLSGRALSPLVRELSTQDDSLTSEAGRTYRFYEFISSLTTMHLRSAGAVMLPPRVFVTLSNK